MSLFKEHYESYVMQVFINEVDWEIKLLHKETYPKNKYIFSFFY